ncbi:isoprenoid synthase domain-containing protein [Podospora fimiseda]|uniref:Terpene synthase n=1 Tax=Podospora fimiseda TaxID=252190 RepID=A0AAN7GVB5_9PEZI|nr:isoprenoid synthase domain-containing protein [Podospora fimiseda]
MSTPAAIQMAARFKGQTLRLPNLKQLLAKWPNTMSPHYEELKEIIEEKIIEWISDEQSRTKARHVNLAFFCASWYPYITLDRLETIFRYSLFLFLWDDIIEDSSISVRTVQQQALKYMEYHLGLCSSSTPEPPCPTKYCSLFQHCALALRTECTVVQRRRFLKQIKEYMAGCEVEQEYVLSGKIPSLKEYWDHRLYTSSVWTYCALADYMAGVNLPEEIYEMAEVKTLWLEQNRHIVILNDIMSFKKEIDKSSFHSLIPVVSNETGADLDTVIASLIKSLVAAGDNLEKALDGLVARVKGDVELETAVQKYAVGFRTNMTGNYWWS